ncbi:MAG: ATPase [Bacteroidetes bacterium 4572_77]|nr:MAG: ATPase [Bacteroidetes bacterium 4572_77]
MKNYKTYIQIKAEVQDVFTALTNPFTIELWSGETAIMSKEINSEFSLWGGDIVGKNLEIVENEKLVQQWYFGEEDETSPSIVSLKLWVKGAQCSVELLHTNIPDEAYDNIVEGWNEAYLGAVKKMMEI